MKSTIFAACLLIVAATAEANEQRNIGGQLVTKATLFVGLAQDYYRNIQQSDQVELAETLGPAGMACALELMTNHIWTTRDPNVTQENWITAFTRCGAAVTNLTYNTGELS